MSNPPEKWYLSYKMKIVQAPATPEKSTLLSDFSGKVFPYKTPEVKVTMEFNYGSKYDGGSISVDLFDPEASAILDVILKNLHASAKERFSKSLEGLHAEYEQCVSMRDWEGCDQVHGKCLLYQDASKDYPPRQDQLPKDDQTSSHRKPSNPTPRLGRLTAKLQPAPRKAAPPKD